MGDSWCAETYRQESFCTKDGKCSNPFRKGCLLSVLDSSETPIRPRACNSDDSEAARANGECVEGDYEEVRILSQDWESPIFASWIMQIILSELLSVPTTIEMGQPKEEASIDFYDPELRFDKGLTFDFGALRTASEHVDCHSYQAELQNSNLNYTSCAHIMPEIWLGQQQVATRLQNDGIVKLPVDAGVNAQYSWYVPRFTAKENYDILTHFGLTEGKDGARRQRMADLFLRPFRWKDFCELFSPDNCTSPSYDDDGRLIAARYPEDASEEQRFFQEGLYHGHFNATKDNDCVANPTTCTGHFAIPPCDWTNFAVPQAHYLDVPVEPKNYLGGEIIEMYHAANYTKNNILVYWYTPDVSVQEFIGTDSEFTPIFLPQATIECLRNRPTTEERCSEDPNERIGIEAGSCGPEAFPVKMLMVSNFNDRIHRSGRKWQSPAYEFIKRFRINELQLEDIYRRWYANETDRLHYDSREAVCLWAAENIDALRGFLPETFPRTIREVKYNDSILIGAKVLSILSGFCVLVVTAMTFYHRKKKVLMYAQPTFLYMLLVGFLLGSIGAYLGALAPSTATCMLHEWFSWLGYSLQLVPIIVKVAAINVLLQGAAKCKRVQISPQKLYAMVGALVGCSAVFLTIWTILDPATKTKHKSPTGEDNVYGGVVYALNYSCSSRMALWSIVAYIYGVLLLVAATVLAFQTRNVRQEFNESVRLGHLIYAHFFFEVLLIIVWVLGPDYVEVIAADKEAAIHSCLLSLEIMISLGVYFLPMFFATYGVSRRRFRTNGSWPPATGRLSSVFTYRGSTPAPTTHSYNDPTDSRGPSERNDLPTADS